MAESAVFFLLDKLTPLLQDEVKLLRGVREEAEYIRAELERMTAFLRVADAMEESTDRELQVWVKQVRYVAYDTDDVLDEFSLRLAHHHGNGFYGYLRKLCCSIKNLRARRQIASKIRSIKSRVSNIAEGHQRYSLKFNISEQASSSRAVVVHSWYDSRGDALLLKEADLVGINKPKQQLIRWLVEGDSRLKVVSVVGMGGLGKTTLVKKVFDDEAVKKHFDCHAWLTVSESFRVEELLKDLIQQLFGEIKQPLPQGVETMNSDRLKETINQFLQERRFVVVLDDVWKIHAWEAVKYAFLGNSCGSCVLLTTRFADIASTSCIDTDGNIYPLNPLSEEESWTLFCKKAFRGNSCPLHLKEISQSILKRCEGLPLAIVTIGGVLATKSKSRIEEWEMLHRSLGVELEGNNKLETMKRLLSLSFNDLPFYPKVCFLYLSSFPEDHQMDCMRLIRLWTAEGFVQVEGGKTIEEVAESYLNELVNRSLVQMAETTIDGRLKTCRVHDLLREIAISKSREQNIATIANGQDTRWPEKVRRLSIHNSFENAQQSNRCFYGLRTLLMFGAESNSSILALMLSGDCRLLKVLDLRGAPLETIPDEVFELLHLRYLSLRETKVKILPNSIGKLRKLETLDLKGTYVTELPVGILRLQQLRHLLLYRYEYGGCYFAFDYLRGFKAPSKIGGLLSLQKLSVIEANHDSGGISIVSEIGRLTQLRRLSIIKLRKEDGKALCFSIGKLSKLRSLTVSSIEEDEIIDLQSLSSAPRFLLTLLLEGRLEKLPQWIPSLHSLASVCLRWSQLRDDDDPLQSLQDLPNLVFLELHQAYEGEGLCFKAGGFQRLKELVLLRLKGLRWVRVEEGAMPLLEKLHMRNCKLVEEVPSGIEHLTKLKYLEFADMSDKLIMRLNRDRGGADYWKMAHIPKVWVGDSKDGYWRVYFYRERK